MMCKFTSLTGGWRGAWSGWIAVLWLCFGCQPAGAVGFLDLTNADIGSPSAPSIVVVRSNALEVIRVTGGDFAMGLDQGNFASTAVSGDFDVQVRVSALSLGDVWSKAGLMARATSDPSSPFVAMLATPSMNGASMVWRAPFGVANPFGYFPANFPSQWFRLQRQGDQFTCYASYDGSAWTQIGSTLLTMADPILLGLAAAGHNATNAIGAEFRDFGPTVSTNTGVQLVRHEELGPSARKSPIVLSEIMYKPAARADGRNVEFVELYNSNPWFHDISGYRLSASAMTYTFPAGTVIPGGGFFVVAAVPADLSAVYGLTNGVYGPYDGSLKATDTLELFDNVGSLLLTVPYTDVVPWPVGASGEGHSIILANPTYGEGDPRAWALSDIFGGSPGNRDPYRPSAARDVVINEILAAPAGGGQGFVELFNTGTNMADLGGLVLTDSIGNPQVTLPGGTTLGAGGFLAVPMVLKASGQAIYLFDPAAPRILDVLVYKAQETGVAYGRSANGGGRWTRLATPTPGAANADRLIDDIVVNELMYNPISGDDDDQYIELYNKGANAVNMDGWSFVSGVSYVFPAVNVAPGGYLVVARNATNLFAKYPNLNTANTVGNYTGKLGHSGDHLALARPMAVDGASKPVIVTDFTFSSGGRWGTWSGGGGSSMELVDPRADPAYAPSWADSDESAKSEWVTIESTGVLDNGANYTATIDRVQLGLLDVGECLVDDIEAVPAGGTNLVINPDFESGAGSWYMLGCMVRSAVEPGGYQSGQALHVRCSDRFWTGANSCEAVLRGNALGGGQTATLRFKARWLHGWPEAILRFHGNWLEAAGALPVPTNLGTPGAANSMAQTNAGPAIYDVTHFPTLPDAGTPVVVKARVDDPDHVGAVTLMYRNDPSTVYNAVTMTDDGTGGDAVAGDGIYSATIPGLGGLQDVAFYVAATDATGASSRFPALANDNYPVREGVIFWGDNHAPGSFGQYHLWVSQTNVLRWSRLPNLSNESSDATFVTGSRVIYNAQGRFAGSPYHQLFTSPIGPLCHYKWIFPDDDKFLGATSFNKIHQPGNGPGDDGSIQREQLANTFLRALGVPWLNRRYVFVYVNGRRRGTLMEDTQTPDSDMVKQWFPNDTGGYLWKMQPWFEFQSAPDGQTIGFNNNAWVDLMPYTTTGGVKKVARYRYNYLTRRTPDSASNYTNVFSLIDAAGQHGAPGYVAAMENMADMENWMRVFAANHAAGNWDAFGSQNGQNLYGYIGAKDARYSLLMWDFNIVIGNSGSWGPGQNLFAVNGADANTQAIYNEPKFRRMYWRALQELVNGPLDIGRSGPLIDAKYLAFRQNGLSVENTVAMKNWLTQAKNSIASQIAAENTTAFLVSSPVVVSNNVAFLTGQAPVVISRILVNNVEYPVTWTSVTSWAAAVPLSAGANTLFIQGVDRQGNDIPGATATRTVNATLPPSPAYPVVINEIMPRPARASASYVELYNPTQTLAQDLSGWTLDGLGYQFPAGSILMPGNYLILAENRPAFAAAYGPQGVFDTLPSAVPERARLMLRDNSGRFIDGIVYSGAPPWPQGADGTGSSLQRIDAAQDGFRPGNWAVTGPGATQEVQWQYVTLTGNATKSLLLIGMMSAGDVYVDDLKLVAGTVPEVGYNYLTNGDFEGPLAGPWTVSANMTGSSISTDIKHSGNASLHVVASSGGPTIAQAIWQYTVPSLVTNAAYTLSYWYRPSSNGSALLIRLSGSTPNSGSVYSLQPYLPVSTGTAAATPGAANSVATTLPAFPPLWINELESWNQTGLKTSAGMRAPWVELYNGGTNATALDGLALSTEYGLPDAWRFPAGVTVPPHGFKVVFADGATNLSTAAELHTGFTLSTNAGSVLLSRAYNGGFQVVDAVDYEALGRDRSYGDYPDGWLFDRQPFYHPTPGATNDSTLPPISVVINEWMASNTQTLKDPADKKYHDWFELYNPSAYDAPLDGYYLSNDPTNRTLFAIPPGYVVPGGGRLVVWADKIVAPTAPEIHADFHLPKSGGGVGIYAADGSVIDTVTFGQQIADVSEGRYPDGGARIGLMAPTPGAPNASPNTAPALVNPGTIYVYSGQTLHVPLVALDPDVPAQILTFGLGAGAPAGLLIDGGDNLVWTPPAAGGWVTNQFTVTVADDGVPPLSDSSTYTVVVAPPFEAGFTVADGQAALTVMAFPGRRYRVESTTDLKAGTWTAVSELTAVDVSVAFKFAVGTDSDRFYRVVLEP
jgi:regulation of enolase protein 1 (concanavalin A-like superfamily)